ncbi:hypothetical protein AHAS_Ahas09G0060800 [Arachis hypogaea]
MVRRSVDASRTSYSSFLMGSQFKNGLMRFWSPSSRCYWGDIVYICTGLHYNVISTQFFGDKNWNQVHLRWLPFVAKLNEMGKYSRGSVALGWWVRYQHQPMQDEKEPMVIQMRLALDRLYARDFVWEPTSARDMVDVIHPRILVIEHLRLWTAEISLIYFAMIE